MKKMNMIKIDDVQPKAEAFAFEGSFAPAYNYESSKYNCWNSSNLKYNTFLIGRS